MSAEGRCCKLGLGYDGKGRRIVRSAMEPGNSRSTTRAVSDTANASAAAPLHMKLGRTSDGSCRAGSSVFSDMTPRTFGVADD